MGNLWGTTLPFDMGIPVWRGSVRLRIQRSFHLIGMSPHRVYDVVGVKERDKEDRNMAHIIRSWHEHKRLTTTRPPIQQKHSRRSCHPVVYPFPLYRR